MSVGVHVQEPSLRIRRTSEHRFRQGVHILESMPERLIMLQLAMRWQAGSISTFGRAFVRRRSRLPQRIHLRRYDLLGRRRSAIERSTVPFGASVPEWIFVSIAFTI